MEKSLFETYLEMAVGPQKITNLGTAKREIDKLVNQKMTAIKLKKDKIKKQDGEEYINVKFGPALKKLLYEKISYEDIGKIEKSFVKAGWDRAHIGEDMDEIDLFFK